jgi:hypothetical protein
MLTFVPCHPLLSSPSCAWDGGYEIEKNAAAKREQQKELVARRAYEKVL